MLAMIPTSFFRYLGKEKIEPAIMVRKGAKVRDNPYRDRVVLETFYFKSSWRKVLPLI